MKSYKLPIILLIFNIIFYQKLISQPELDSTIFTIDNEKVKLVEIFKANYKNNWLFSSGSNIDSINKRFELYLNNRLKIHEAILIGIDKNNYFQTEFENYKESLSKYYSSTILEDILMQYYHGMLIFEITDRKVWSRASNEAELFKFMKSHNYPQKYKNEKEILADTSAFAKKIISDYMTYLEKNWIDSLRGVFTINVEPNSIQLIQKFYPAFYTEYTKIRIDDAIKNENIDELHKIIELNEPYSSAIAKSYLDLFINELITISEDSLNSTEDRINAIKKLGEIGDSCAILSLIKIIREDENIEICLKSISALEEIDEPDISIPGLINVIETTQNFTKRLIIILSFIEITPKELLKEDVIPMPIIVNTIVDVLWITEFNFIHKESIDALRKIGKPAISELIKILSNTDDEYKQAEIVITLGEIGYEAVDAIPAIIEFFPSLENIINIDQPGGGPAGSFYLHYRKDVNMSNVGSMVYEVEELATKYGKYLKINIASGFIESYSIKDWGEFYGPYTKKKIFVHYIIEAAPYSLNKITHEDFGNDKDVWQQWWTNNKDRFE